MIKTAQEIAALKLPGLPTTLMGVWKMIQREKWETVGKNGKAVLYQVPVELQAQIIAAMPDGLEIGGVIEGAQDKRQMARLIILYEFERYFRASGLKIGKAEDNFVAIYNAQAQSRALDPFPRQLFDVFSSISPAAMRSWRLKFKQGSGALRDGYGNRKGQSILARANGGKVEDAIVALICEKPLISAGHVRDMIRIDFGTILDVDGRKVELPKIRAFERFITSWKAENPELYLKATNPDAWRNKFMLAVGSNSEGIVRLNQRWEIDASPIDVLCTDGRYLIYALVDVWSRRLMLHVSRTATTEGSLTLIRRACMEWGMPESIRTDNGSDFISHRFKQALLHLGVEQVVSGPFQPWKKAFVERAIKTFQHHFTPIMPGFIGHSVADRKMIESAKSFAANLGTDKSVKLNVQMTHTELQEHINNWVDGYYHQKPHKSLGGYTPFAKVASSTEKPRMVESERALDVLFAPVAGLRRVGKEAIRVEGAHFWHNDLALYMGKDVYVRLNPDDMGRIYVFDTDHTFICEAVNYDRLGADRAEVAAAAKAIQKKVISEELAEIKKTARREYSPGKVAEKSFSDFAKAAHKVAAFPKQTELYTTPSINEAARAVTKDTIIRTEEENARQEAFVATFADYQAPEPVKTDAEIWWERAKALEAKVEAGENLTEREAAFLQNAYTASWYKLMAEREAQLAELLGG